METNDDNSSGEDKNGAYETLGCELSIVQSAKTATDGENRINSGTIGCDPSETSEVALLLVNMSNSVVGQDEEIVELGDDLKERLKSICSTVFETHTKHEESHRLKALDIAKVLAAFLIEETSSPLYTIEMFNRINNSSRDSFSVNYGYHLKASPLLLEAFKQIKTLYEESGVNRPDASLKIFAEYVCTALCQIDNTLQSLDNYTLKKVHLAEKKTDETIIYWLDPTPENTLVLASDHVDLKTKRKSPTPNSLPTRILSDRKCKNAIKPKELTGDMGSFITKKTKSKKKKTIVNKVKCVFEEAIKSGMNTTDFIKMFNKVCNIPDNVMEVEDESDEEEEEDENENEIDENENEIDENDISPKEIAFLIRSTFRRKVSSYIKIPEAMEKFISFLNEETLLKIEEGVKLKGKKQFGIYQRKFSKSQIENTRSYDIECFFKSVANFLNTTVSDRHCFVVTTEISEQEEFVNVSDEKYYTLILGYMPNTIIKTEQMVDDHPIAVEIDFNKGDLIILNDSIKCMYRNSTYTANKTFEVLYMFLDNNK